MTENPMVGPDRSTALNFAAQQLLGEKKTSYEVIQALKEQGHDDYTATTIVDDLQQQIDTLQKEKAKKDMLYGALWCVGGTVLTLADIGFIFWGAIVFGAIQFFRGLANS